MNEPRQQVLPVGTRIGVYEIRRVIGAGRFGITYRVWNQHLNAEMALKEYFPRDIVQRAADGLTVLRRSENKESLFQRGLKRFSEDAGKLARVEHPHLERVQNNLQIHETVYLAMEYEDGIPLSRLIERSGTVLDEEQLKLIFLPIIEALGKVHEAGVLHGDIIPANILLRKSGESVLLDFASARLALAAPLGISLEVFSEGYAPAEQYDPRGQIGPWSDLYSIGATMYRCVTGNDPLSATDRLADVSKGKSDPQWPAIEAAVSGYPESFLKAIDWMLSIHPEDRPQSAGPVLESFNSQSDGEEAEADEKFSQQSNPDVAHTKPSASRKSRLPVSLLVFVSIAAVLLIGTVFWFSGRDRRADEILAAAESHRMGSLDRSADKTLMPHSTSIPHSDIPENAVVSESGPNGQASSAADSGSDVQTPNVDREQGVVDIGSDALAERSESTSEEPDPVREAIESIADSSDSEGEKDISDTNERVDFPEAPRREDETAGTDRDLTETGPESLSTPPIVPEEVIENTDQEIRPGSSGNTPGQRPREEDGSGQGAMRSQQEAQTEPTSAHKDTPSETEFQASSSSNLPEEPIHSPAEESVLTVIAESEEADPAARSQGLTASEAEPAVDESQTKSDGMQPESRTAQAMPTRESVAASQTATLPDTGAEPGAAKEADNDEPLVLEAPESGQSQIAERSTQSEPDEGQTPAQEVMALPSGESVDSQVESSTLSLHDRIAQHMAAAEEDIKALRLSTPQGDNALEHYQAVLTLDSDHTEAQEGVRHIVELYGWLIDTAIEKEQLVAARVYLQRAEEIMPQAPELQQARLDLSAAQPAQEEKSAQEAE